MNRNPSRPKEPAVPARPVFSARADLLALGIVIALCMGATAVHLTAAWNGIRQGAAAAAQALAGTVGERGKSPEQWLSEVAALAAGTERRIPDGEWHGVRDSAGVLLAQSGESPGEFWVTGSASMTGPAGSKAVVQVARSLRPLNQLLLMDLLLSGVAGTFLFQGLRRLVARLERQHSGTMASRLRQARSESAQVLRVLFERSEDGLYICDGEGRVLACNPAAGRQLATASDSVVGTLLTDWISCTGPSSASTRPQHFPLTQGEATVNTRGGQRSFAAQIEVHETHQDGSSRFIVGVRDLTHQRQTQRTLEYLANYDSLTGLPNRVLFRDRLAGAMERANRTGRPMALFFLDLDRFKVVNDSLGHEAGDKLLRHVSEVLTRCLRGTDSIGRSVNEDPFTLSRLGGDEFTVIAEEIGGAEDAALIARRLLDALAVPFFVGDEELQVSASIGISLYPTDDVDLDGMIRHTDMAMYRSKSLGRNTYSFFSDDLNAAVSARLSLEGSLRRAIERKEFILHFQPKADLVSGEVTGVEALLRWHCPGRGMVPPDRFITVLEDTGLIVQAGAWVIRAACAQLAEWDQMGLPRINMAVNLSARQLRHPYLVALVEDTLRETGVDPSRLELELTESLLMEDTEGNRAVLTAFQRLGVRLAIDDFGTGHSSLSYLRRLDVDTLKIDRSFVTQIPNDPEDCAIATAVIALGKSLQMKVVAEGVETQAQADFLLGLGCNEMQGWLLSKALPADQIQAWMRQRHAVRQSKRFASDDAKDLPRITIPDVPRTKPATGAARASESASEEHPGLLEQRPMSGEAAAHPASTAETPSVA